MGKDGLRAESYRNWIDDSIRIDESVKVLVEEFVLGTPAFGLSEKGRDLYEYYNLHNPEDYHCLKEKMFENLEFHSFETYAQLKNALLDNSNVLFSDIPPMITEAIYLHSGRLTTNPFYVKYFKDTMTSVDSKQTFDDGTKPTEFKRDVVGLERVFAHLRNGIAHGRFAKCERNHEVYYIFQDEYQGDISAKMIIKESRLMHWIILLNELTKKTSDRFISKVSLDE